MTVLQCDQDVKLEAVAVTEDFMFETRNNYNLMKVFLQIPRGRYFL